MMNTYKRQMGSLPKGTLSVKKIGNNEYYYLKYRNGKKVVSDYVGKEHNKIDEIRLQLERRKQIEEILKELSKELNVVKKFAEE